MYSKLATKYKTHTLFGTVTYINRSSSSTSSTTPINLKRQEMQAVLPGLPKLEMCTKKFQLKPR